MDTERVFHSSEHVKPCDGNEPFRSVVTQSDHVTVVAWHVKKGQRIAAHTHPHGQDTWTVLSGGGEYQTDAAGGFRIIVRGDVAVARVGDVHGVYNPNEEPLVFISVVAPAEAGFQLLAQAAPIDTHAS